MRFAPALNDDFDTAPPERGGDEPRLVVDVGGFEGPLDLLLDLARRQKVDLHEISILALAEQYLAFIEAARGMRLELAADYLVMAAWLAYLKSRLLLPEPPRPEGPSAGELASALASRLRRLEAMRQAARLLESMPQLGRDVFPRGRQERGRDEAVPDGVKPDFTASIFDLLDAYAKGRGRRAVPAAVTVARRPVWTLAQARDALQRLIGHDGEWVALDVHLVRFLADPTMRASILASSLSAILEMVREGEASLMQEGAFAPLLVRRNGGQPELVA